MKKSPSLAPLVIVLSCAVVGSLATLSAHVVRGLTYPSFATAFVSSPSAGTDSPIPVAWGSQATGLRVICFSTLKSRTKRVSGSTVPSTATPTR